MINRYQGNSGKVVRVEERPGEQRPGEQRKAAQPHMGQNAAKAPGPRPQKPEAARPQSGMAHPAPGGSMFGALGRLLPGGGELNLGSKLGSLETEDLILLLILYLMYRESGDSELLMVMGAMFLL